MNQKCKHNTETNPNLGFSFSFSLGSVSTLIRRGGHFYHICVKRFLLFTTEQKL